MKTLILAVSTILLTSGSAFGQDQDGSVAIAGSIRLDSDDATLDGYAGCVEKLKLTGTKDKDARSGCLKFGNVMRRTSEHVATEASRAARRPIFLNQYGYGYGGRCCGSGSGQSYEAREKQRVEQAKAREERAAVAAQARNQRLADEAKARRERTTADALARNQRLADEAKARRERLAKEKEEEKK